MTNLAKINNKIAVTDGGETLYYNPDELVYYFSLESVEDILVIERFNVVLYEIPTVDLQIEGEAYDTQNEILNALAEIFPSTSNGVASNATIQINNKPGPVINLNKADIGLDKVDNTPDTDKPVSGPQAAALADKADKQHPHEINDVDGLEQRLAAAEAQAGSVNVSKEALGLNFVDNTPDLLKPISNDVAEELAKRPTLDNANFSHSPTAPTPAKGTNDTKLATTQFVHEAISDINVDGAGAVNINGQTASQFIIDKNFIGLSAVDNTPDADKPVSGPQAAAIASKAPLDHTHPAADIDGIDAIVETQTAGLAQEVAGKAPLVQPAFQDFATVPDLAPTENSGKVANTKFVQALFAETFKLVNPSGLKTSETGDAMLGGSLTEDAEIDINDRALLFNAPEDSVAGANFTKITKAGLEGFARSLANTLSQSSYKMDGDEFIYSAQDNTLRSSTVQVRKDFVSFTNVDPSGNKTILSLDNTTDKASLSLLFITADGTKSKGLSMSVDNFRLGFSATGEEDVIGFDFKETGISLTGDIPQANPEKIYSVLLKDQVTGDITERPESEFFIDVLTEAQQEAIAANFQPLNPNLTSIAGAEGTSGVPRKIANETWVLDEAILPVEEWFSRYMFSYSTTSFNSATLTNSGLSVTAVGAGSPNAQAWAVTNNLTRSKRLHYSPAATTAGSIVVIKTDFKFVWRGNAVGLGGFFKSCKFGYAVLAATNIMFEGLWAGTTGEPLATDNPSSLTNIIGVCKDAADPLVWSIIHNDATGACTKVSTGIAIVNTTHYKVDIWCSPFGDEISVSVQDLSSANPPFVYTTAVDIPDNVTALGWMLTQSNNATAGNFTISYAKVVIRHNN